MVVSSPSIRMSFLMVMVNWTSSSALIDALAGERSGSRRGTCDAADIGRKQHLCVRPRKGLHALRALLADVALDLRISNVTGGVAGIVAYGLM